MVTSNSFIEKLKAIVLANYTNEHFGVSDLVDQFGMSRSQLHRKLKVATGQSVSQFIREIRLDEALKLLQNNDVTASEAAYQVGFNSPTYFNTCFNDYFGYPPGEVKHQMALRAANGASDTSPEQPATTNKRLLAWLLIISVLVISYFIFRYFQQDSPDTAVVSSEKLKSIAVLPFKNWSGDPELEYVSDGMTDAVITRLSKISEMDKVVPFSTVINYKNSEKNTETIAKELNVEYILEGNFKLSGDKVMSNLNLIEVATNNFIWTLEYSGQWKADEIFEMQADVAENVAENMAVNVSTNEKTEINSRPTSNEEAYRLFLKAEDQFYRLNQYGMENSVKLYKEAIALDSSFVDPYVGLGRTYNVSGLVWGLLPEQEAWKQAKKYFKMALERDTLGAGYNSEIIEFQLVGGAFYYEYDIKNAELQYQKTLLRKDKLNYRDYGFDYSRKTGRFDYSMKLIEREIKRYPVVGDGHMQRAFILFMLGDKKSAIEQLSALDPFYQDNYFYLLETSKWYFYMGETNKSATHLVVLLKKYEDRPPIVQWLMAIHADLQKDSTKLNSSLNQLNLQYKNGNSGSPAWFLALYYCHIKDYDKTFQWLNRSYNNREVEMTWLMQEPMLQPLTDDPRYIELYNKVGFDVIKPLPAIAD